jgi:hypothetical protein
LRLTLLANDRDHHGTTSVGSFAPDIRVEGERLLLNDAGLFSLTIRAPGGNIAPSTIGIWISICRWRLSAA